MSRCCSKLEILIEEKMFLRNEDGTYVYLFESILKPLTKCRIEYCPFCGMKL